MGRENHPQTTLRHKDFYGHKMEIKAFEWQDLTQQTTLHTTVLPISVTYLYSVSDQLC